jgi:mRNA interferase RelE/StbE
MSANSHHHTSPRVGSELTRLPPPVATRRGRPTRRVRGHEGPPGAGLTSRYTLRVAPTARKQLAEELPASIAFAAHAFIVGPLLDNPHRVGKRLRPPLADRHSARRGTYRVVYRIDDENNRVDVLGVFNRADAYRRQL